MDYTIQDPYAIAFKVQPVLILHGSFQILANLVEITQACSTLLL